MISLTASADGSVWKVEGELIIQTAAEVLKTSDELPVVSDWAVDLGGTAKVDSSAVGVLLAWRRRAEREGHQVHFDNLPTMLAQLIDLYDVREVLDL